MGGSKLLQNVSNQLPVYTLLHQRLFIISATVYSLAMHAAVVSSHTGAGILHLIHAPSSPWERYNWSCCSTIADQVCKDGRTMEETLPIFESCNLCNVL
jgi:hypothetical protein